MSKTIIGIFSNPDDASRAADHIRRLPDVGIRVKITQRTAKPHGNGFAPAALSMGPLPAISPEGGILPAFSGLETHQPQPQQTTAVEVTCDESMAQTAAAQLRSLGAEEVRE